MRFVWVLLDSHQFPVSSFATTMTSCSTVFPKPIISCTNARIVSAPVCFYSSLKDDSLQPGWLTAECVCIIISFTGSVCRRIACGRPPSLVIRSDFGFRLHAGERRELQTWKVKTLLWIRLISSQMPRHTTSGRIFSYLKAEVRQAKKALGQIKRKISK